MINLLIGGPGGGKSYEAVAFHVLPALKRGRKVITNLPLNLEAFEAIEPGSSSLIELRTKTLASEPENAGYDEGGNGLQALIMQARAAKFVSRPFANVEDFASDWRDADGLGPLYVVDECHFALPKGGTARAVEEWFSMHRHFNVDVLLITQSSGKISVSIKDLVQVCYKVRKAIALGRPDGYIRKVLDGVNGGEVSTSERKYKPAYFKLYRSHTQGVALDEQNADDVAPLLVRFNRFKWAWMAITLVACIYAFWPKSKHVEPVPKWLPAAVAEYKANPPPWPEPGVPGPSGAASAPSAAASAPVLEVVDLEPFKSQSIHLTGWAKLHGVILHTFAIANGGLRVFDMTEPQMALAGYRYEALADCAGVLHWGKKSRTVICDAPVLAAGKDSVPLVIADGSRKTSRD